MTKEEALAIIEKYLPWSETRGDHWGKSYDPRAYPEALEAWSTLIQNMGSESLLVGKVE